MPETSPINLEWKLFNSTLVVNGEGWGGNGFSQLLLNGCNWLWSFTVVVRTGDHTLIGKYSPVPDWDSILISQYQVKSRILLVVNPETRVHFLLRCTFGWQHIRLVSNFHSVASSSWWSLLSPSFSPSSSLLSGSQQHTKARVHKLLLLRFLSWWLSYRRVSPRLWHFCKHFLCLFIWSVYSKETLFDYLGCPLQQREWPLRMCS